MSQDPPWLVRSACRGADTNIFYPEKGRSAKEAKAWCQACQVRLECLNLALRNQEQFGVWGGMSPRERRRLLRMKS